MYVVVPSPSRSLSWAFTWILIPNPTATLYYVEHVHTAQILTQIPTPYYCTGQESESKSEPESVSGNVNEPLGQ